MKKIIFLTLLCSLVLPVVAAAGTDDDVTQQENVIYVEDATVEAGNSTTVVAKLRTNVDAVAFQFDLVLPEGISLSGNTAAAVRKAELETNQHQLVAAWLKSGACRVICYSLSNDQLKKMNGDAALIDIDVDAKLSPGTYPVILRNVEIAQENGQKSKKLSEVQTTITIQNGDVPTIIELTETKENTTDDATYNLLGQKVKELRRGQIGVKKGKKTIKQ